MDPPDKNPTLSANRDVRSPLQPTSITTTPTMNFANAVRSPSPTPTSPTTATTTTTSIVAQSRLWRTARSKNALLFDITSLPSSLTHQWFMKHIYQQTDVVFGLLVKKANQQRFLEVYCKKGVNHNLLTEDLVFPVNNKVYKILPCVSLDDDSTIVRLSLSNLPMLDEPELLEGLNLSLRPYGIVHHVELFKDPSFGFFMGTGYAIINQQSNDQKKLATLTHKINYGETGEGFHATWANMPVYCRYCHGEGHTKLSCQEAAASTMCYNCHNLGHRAAYCPQLSIKKARKAPMQPTIDDGFITIPAAKPVVKSVVKPGIPSNKSTGSPVPTSTFAPRLQSTFASSNSFAALAEVDLDDSTTPAPTARHHYGTRAATQHYVAHQSVDHVPSPSMPTDDDDMFGSDFDFNDTIPHQSNSSPQDLHPEGSATTPSHSS